MRIFLAITLAIFILTGIGLIFWQQEWKFSKPTPQPSGYTAIEKGDSVSADLLASLGLKNDELAFIHFYNFDCPCSRFNIREFQDLVIQYGKEVKFLSILETVERDDSEIKEFKEKYDLGIDTHLDKEGSIAKELGIYSTPQAVLIKNRKIFFSGNYNKARFCTTQNTKFANLALSAMIEGKEPPLFPELASVAYGCELPANGNADTRIDKFFNFLIL